jgi:carotenoid cleavage dioxygenase-like enzyme
MRFNMKTGAASQKQLSVSAVDFPRVNESYTGRYLYWKFSKLTMTPLLEWKHAYCQFHLKKSFVVDIL